MPKKPARTKASSKSTKNTKKPVKKVAKPAAKKKTVAKKTVAKPAMVVRPQQRSTTAPTRTELPAENPNAKALLVTFLVSFGLLLYLYMKLGW